MAAVEKLVFAILKFLEEQKGSVRMEVVEVLDVAMHCLQRVFKMNLPNEEDAVKYWSPHLLLDIFRTALVEATSEICPLMHIKSEMPSQWIDETDHCQSDQPKCETLLSSYVDTTQFPGPSQTNCGHVDCEMSSQDPDGQQNSDPVSQNFTIKPFLEGPSQACCGHVDSEMLLEMADGQQNSDVVSNNFATNAMLLEAPTEIDSHRQSEFDTSQQMDEKYNNEAQDSSRLLYTSEHDCLLLKEALAERPWHNHKHNISLENSWRAIASKLNKSDVFGGMASATNVLERVNLLLERCQEKEFQTMSSDDSVNVQEEDILCLQLLEKKRKMTETTTSGEMRVRQRKQGNRSIKDKLKSINGKLQQKFQIGLDGTAEVCIVQNDKEHLATTQNLSTLTPATVPRLEDLVPGRIDEEFDDPIDIEYVVSKSENVGNVVNQKRKTKLDKSHYCLFCEEPQKKLDRHLCCRHSDKKEVIKLMAAGKDERKKLLISLRHKGDHIHNLKVIKEKDGELVVKRNKTHPEKQSAAVTIPCPTCLGHYDKKYLYRHKCKLDGDR